MLGSNFLLLCQLPNPISVSPCLSWSPQVWDALLSTAWSQSQRLISAPGTTIPAREEAAQSEPLTESSPAHPGPRLPAS